MPQTTQPTMTADWTDGSASRVAAPTPAQMASGFTAGQRPTYQLLNFLFFNAGTWISWLAQQANSNTVSATLDPLMRLIGGGQWSWNANSGVLAWSQPLYLQVPGLSDSANTLAAGSVTLSAGQVAYFNANVPFSATATTTTGSSQLTNLSFELGIVAGQQVTGAGIPSGTTVIAVSGTTVTISQAATASASGVQLEFVSSGTLTASTAAVSTLSPGPNTIIFARGVIPTVIVGVNAGQFVLRDGEVKLLDEGGFTTVAPATAGVALTARQAVYFSAGSSDGGRTQAAAYPADASVANGPFRSTAVGLVAAPAAAGAAVNVVTAGLVAGFTGLIAGSVYYLDPTTPGNLVTTKPAVVGQYVLPLGTAISSTTLALSATVGSAAAPVVSISPWPQYGVNAQSDLVAAVAACSVAGGGVIVVLQSFALSAPITLPAGTLLLGRRGGATIQIGTSGSLTLADTSELRDLSIAATSAGSGTLVNANGNACVIRSCSFTQPAASTGTCVAVRGNSNRLYNNVFSGVTTAAATGINYISGTGNFDDSSVILS